MKKLIYSEVARYQPASLRKLIFQTSSFMYFSSIFSERITITSSEEAFQKSASTHFFWKYKQKVVLLAIYLFNYNSSKSTLFIQTMTFDVVLSTIFVKLANWSPSFLVVRFCSTQKVKRNHYKNVLPLCSACIFWYVILIDVFHHCDDFYIKFTISAIISAIKKCLCLTWCDVRTT